MRKINKEKKKTKSKIKIEKCCNLKCLNNNLRYQKKISFSHLYTKRKENVMKKEKIIQTRKINLCFDLFMSIIFHSNS